MAESSHRVASFAMSVVLVLSTHAVPPSPRSTTLGDWKCADVAQSLLSLPTDVSSADLPTGEGPEAQPASARPVILVHGWTDGPGGMNGIANGIAGGLRDKAAIFRFDYTKLNDRWAGEPEIAGCLAAYIDAVAWDWASRGGDGRVMLVGHSMGGLAIRYASKYLIGGRSVAKEMGGVVTVDTPHLGATWGGTSFATFHSTAARLRLLDVTALPDPASGAARCLASRAEHSQLPQGCRGGPPPYLPDNVTVRQIAGQVSVTRDFFGLFGSANYPLDGDGIVSIASQHGYSWSGPEDASSPNHPASTTLVRCEVTGNAMARRAVAAGEAVWHALSDAFGALKDRIVADDPGQGGASAELLPITLLALVTADCGHNRITSSASGVEAIVGSVREVMLSMPAGQPEADPYVLSVNGIGPYRIGRSTGAELLTARLLVDDGPDASCGNTRTPQGRFYVAAGAYRYIIEPLYANGRVDAIGTGSEVIRSSAGGRVGMTLEQLRQVYGLQGEVNASASAGRVLVFRFGTRVEVYVFGDQSTVTWWAAGEWSRLDRHLNRTNSGPNCTF